MSAAPVSSRKPEHLVLMGGGHAQVAVLKDLAMRPIPGLATTLISRDIMTPYSGMLPGYLEGLYTEREIAIDLSHLARMAGARLIEGEVTAIDPATRKLTIAGRPAFGYDLLSINIGSNTDLTAIAGAEAHAIPVKPISTLLGRLENVLCGGVSPGRIVIIGGGAAGVEVAFSLRRRLADAAITLLHRGKAPVAEYPPKAGRDLHAMLTRAGVEVRLGAAVAAIKRGRAVLADGEEVTGDAVFVITAGAPPQWLQQTGLPLDKAGFIKTTPTLQVQGHPTIFATGDIAALTDAPRPKAGVFAVRAGRHLAGNIRRVLEGGKPQVWQPQKNYLALVGTGGREAYAVRGNISRHMGRAGWWWKEKIDRAFMDKFAPQPAMAMTMDKAGAHDSAADDSADGGQPVMRCLGCGGKAGYATLAEALEKAAAFLATRYPAHRKMAGAAIHDDIAALPVPADGRLVQSVDILTAIVDDAFVLGRIAALHALSDLFAGGAKPVAAQAIITLPEAAPQLHAETLTHLLAGAMCALAEHETPLLGGHSNIGEGMQVGFAVTGQLPAKATQRMAQKGDALVLTKPIGIGVIMAAHAAGDARASGRMRSAAIDLMTQSNAGAAAIFAKHAAPQGTFAMTDVTGFGLGRHAMNLCGRGGAALVPAFDDTALPLIEGAGALFAAGHASSIAPENTASIPLEADGGVETAPYYDPQTGGGLLAAIPRRALPALQHDFAKAGMDLFVVGEVIKGKAVTVRGGGKTP